MWAVGLIEHEVVDVFTAQVSERISVLPNPLEVMDVDWVDLDNLARLTRKEQSKYTPWLKIYLSEHANQIFA